MAKHETQTIPRTAAAAAKRGYKKVVVRHSSQEKKKWVWVKHKGKQNWEFARAASVIASGPHIVCYWDPNQRAWTDCHQV